MKLVRRTWGWYLTLLNRAQFKVKILRFQRGKECSYQWHHHRNELWLFLKGRGRFVLNGGVTYMRAGGYKMVYAEDRHKFRADETTLVLEAQFGEKCVEEDITRMRTK